MKNRKPTQPTFTKSQSNITDDMVGCCAGSTTGNKPTFLFKDLYEFPDAGDALSSGYMQYPNGDAEFLKLCTALGNNSPTLRRIIEQQINLCLAEISSDDKRAQEYIETPVNDAGDMLIDVLEAYLYDRCLYGNAALVSSRIKGTPRLRHIPTPRWRYKEEVNESSDTIFESAQFEDSDWWSNTDSKMRQ